MKNYLSTHATQAAYTSAQSAFDKPHVAFIQEIAGLADSVIYMEKQKQLPHNYANDYFTIEALENCTVYYNTFQGELNAFYSKDNGYTWTQFMRETPIGLNANEKMLIKCTFDDNGTDNSGQPLVNYITGIQCSNNYNISGNIMSLLYGDNFAGKYDLSELLFTPFIEFFKEQNIVNAQNLILPATTLVNSCYSGMFYGCTALTTAPALPATTLAMGCYGSMFEGCIALTTAPELPATTLADNCYYQMFLGCTSLNYIKCLATDISESGCTYNWVYNVAASGTFVKNASMSSWTTGDNDGIPSGWTVQDAA